MDGPRWNADSQWDFCQYPKSGTCRRNNPRADAVDDVAALVEARAVIVAVTLVGEALNVNLGAKLG